MRKLAITKVFIVSALLSGCAALGIPTPQSFEDKVAVGYGTVETVAVMTKTLARKDAISKKDALNVYETAKSAKEGLDFAVSVHDTLPDVAETKLEVTLLILNKLNSYLEERT